jgi:hypothetical protein
VKLWQFDPADRVPLRVDTTKLPYAADPQRHGVRVATLFQHPDETVTLEQWGAGAEITLSSAGGLELLVIEGDFTEGEDRFSYQSWLRLPPGSRARVRAGEKGCRVWMKTGHLERVRSAGSAFKAG